MARQPQRAEQRPAETFKVFRPEVSRYDLSGIDIPDGITYEWKRLTNVGQEDRRHQVNLSRNMWTAVPAERHPELGGDPLPDVNGKPHPHIGSIILDGLILMERPAEITRLVREQDARMAKSQVGEQITRLKLAPDGTLGDEKGERTVRLRRDRDLSIPEGADIV